MFVVILLLLGLAFAVNMLTGAGTATAAACGRADIDRKYSLINLGLNIVLTVILALTFGDIRRYIGMRRM